MVRKTRNQFNNTEVTMIRMGRNQYNYTEEIMVRIRRNLYNNPEEILVGTRIYQNKSDQRCSIVLLSSLRKNIENDEISSSYHILHVY
jgi:hypothetical protein